MLVDTRGRSIRRLVWTLVLGLFLGALFSKLAELFLPESAARDFKRFNKGYKPSWYRNRWLNNPQKLIMHSLYFRFPALIGPLMRMTDTGLPGIDSFMSGMRPEYVGRY